MISWEEPIAWICASGCLQLLLISSELKQLMLLSNDTKQVAESHFLCAFILAKVEDGGESVPERGDCVRVVPHPGLCRNLLCPAQQFGVLSVPLVQAPFPASEWVAEIPPSVAWDLAEGRSRGWVDGGAAIASDSQDGCMQGLILWLRCPNIWWGAR